MRYHNDPMFSDRLVWANSADPDQTAPRGAVLSGSSLEEQSYQGPHCCYSICIFLTKYPKVWPLCP